MTEIAAESNTHRLSNNLFQGKICSISGSSQANLSIMFKPQSSGVKLFSSTDTDSGTQVKERSVQFGLASSELTGHKIREIVIEQSFRAGVGHIGSALSISDLIACLYGEILKIESPDHPDRDRFILSKGHAALALYAAFHLRGWLSQEMLDTYCQDGSILGVHPELKCTGVDFATGSLGQGLSFAAGAALAAKLENSQRRIFAIISDAECNEGATWEAIMFAAQHKLDNLYVLLDWNGQQAFGYTKDVLDLSPIEVKFKTFGWDTYEIDGHDTEAILSSVKQAGSLIDKPHVLVARTTFGKGVSFMEHQIKWHYSPINQNEYETALAELRLTP